MDRLKALEERVEKVEIIIIKMYDELGNIKAAIEELRADKK